MLPQPPLVLVGEAPDHPPRPCCGFLSRDRRVQNPELSAFLWAARGGGQRSLASHPERLIAGSGMGNLSQSPRTIKTGARTLYRRGEPISTSDRRQVCPKMFISGMVD